jgi:hypothetical protein
MICQRWRSPSAADHQCRIRGGVKQRVTYSTDNSDDVTRRVTAHDGQLDGFPSAGQKFSSASPRGSWTDVQLAITIHPPAQTTIQLAVGNLAQTPTPDSERQYRCIAQSRLSEAVLEYRVVAGRIVDDNRNSAGIRRRCIVVGADDGHRAVGLVGERSGGRADQHMSDTPDSHRSHANHCRIV